MRPPDPTRPRHPIPWPKVLYRRLTLHYEEIPSGQKTLDAEDGLNINPPCAYFYIGICHPRFGDKAIIFRAIPKPSLHVCPFDTGGLWADNIITHERLSVEQKRALVARYDLTAIDYIDRFRDWGRSSYEKPSDYVNRVVPREAFAPEINVVASGTDGGSWMWEGRVVRDRVIDSLTPVDLFLQTHQLDEYDKWLRDQPEISTAEHKKHLEQVLALFRDAGLTAPAQAANQYLRELQLW